MTFMKFVNDFDAYLVVTENWDVLRNMKGNVTLNNRKAQILYLLFQVLFQ